MKRFIQGENRTQGILLPELLDDYVADTNPVRVIDVFVDELDLGKLGFAGISPAATGRRITRQFVYYKTEFLEVPYRYFDPPFASEMINCFLLAGCVFCACSYLNHGCFF